jgi:hypothetical protein
MNFVLDATLDESANSLSALVSLIAFASNKCSDRISVLVVLSKKVVQP